MSPELRAQLDRRESMLAAVRSVLVDHLRVPLKPEQITGDTALFGTGLGLDSIDAVDLVTGLAQATGIRVPEHWEGRVALRSVNALLDHLLAAEVTLAD